MVQFTTIPTFRVKKVTDAPRRFISTLKSRRRGVYLTTALVLAVVILVLKSRVSPAVKVDRVLTPSVLQRLLEENASSQNVSSQGVPDEGVARAAAPDPSIPRGEPGKCLKHVLYDKPVKTGSTAITNAIREYLRTFGESDHACSSIGPYSCVARAKAICNGTVGNVHYYSILGHLRGGGRELAECLKPNYYVVTSIREPYQRRKSAYLWNRTLNGTHFGIPHTVTFKEFMNRMPRCQLYHYYDGKGQSCDVGIPMEQRIRDIVDRVDEVIDVYGDKPAGALHKLIAGYLTRDNESIKIDESDYIEEFDRNTLKEEQILYDRLREKRLQPPNPERLLC